MDKRSIEKIADPLVHLIRNAVDHGIEAPERRRAAGKAERGRVGLRARYEGSDILIEVSDDGAGFDDEAVLRCAVERGLVAPGTALSRDQVRELVFMPGFSTSREVTDISGRGVGLDVVRRNLEKLRGGVEVSWEKGEGTTFALRIPLTLAIIDAMKVRAGSRGYAIPVCDIREFFKPRDSQLLRAGGERVELRGEFLPLVRLDESLELSPGSGRSAPAECIAIVAEAGGRRACLLIDEIVGAQQVVVKPLPEYLGEADGLSGCSVDGDGGVSFIVDTARVLARAF